MATAMDRADAVSGDDIAVRLEQKPLMENVLTEQQEEFVRFPKSSILLGRSGTGKTTLLATKLFLRQRQFREEGRSLPDDAEEGNSHVLRQLFLTSSPKLCLAVRRQLSKMDSTAGGGMSKAESYIGDSNFIDAGTLFGEIPDNFSDISADSYPLSITFDKFLVMLDGTVGASFFDKFPGFKLGSVSLQSLRKVKEVNFAKFTAVYWPRFNEKLRRGLDASIVFAEIISHIKCGIRSGDQSLRTLSRTAYIALSEGRASTVSTRKREDIYDIFEYYEKMKTNNQEYDVSDFLSDLIRRLCCESFKGQKMDFVYVDEVQDLTISQIYLLKYICINVEEGFTFSGDIAQTIARGIDFRFEDLRSVFYTEFLNGLGKKGQLSKTFILDHNFRTHSGILKLAQSIIDLIHHFFPSAIDALSPEASKLSGDVPVLLESENDENAIISIFGNSSKLGTNVIAFGAEQVILVRDEHARDEVLRLFDQQTLVLTIAECKGLEFQDVFLYDFFGSSALQNRWRVVYEYMKERDWLGDSTLGSYPCFDEAKHASLCSELKQLYVAITRARRKLWICENRNDSSGPLFEYWKRLCLVNARKIDGSLVEAMQAGSTAEEWKSRGFKLLNEGNYSMATLCFRKAGYTYGEKLAKASGLKAEADLKHASSPQEANNLRKQAAEIFESIGMVSSSAECLSLIEEFNKAGRSKCEQRGQQEKLLAYDGCHDISSKEYLSATTSSKFLNDCTEMKLFEKGLHHIESRRTNGGRSGDMQKLEQDFLEAGALHYHNLKDNSTMMKFVKAFDFKDRMQRFLRSVGRLEELIRLEEDFGDFLEAAGLARIKGDIALQVDLLSKGEYFREASICILFYVLSHSLWACGGNGWPLKVFAGKAELLEKAKALTKLDCEDFFQSLSTEIKILSGEDNSIAHMIQHLDSSRRHASIKGEFLCARCILDLHLDENVSRFCYEDKVVVNGMEYSEAKLSENCISNETLFFIWNHWKDLVVRVISCAQSQTTQEKEERESCWDFCLNYLGVVEEPNRIYILLHGSADWCRNIKKRSCLLGLVSVDRRQLASAAAAFWSGELLAVGLRVLEKFNDLYQFSAKRSVPNFCQCRCLLHMYEISDFLVEAKFLRPTRCELKALMKYIEIPINCYFGHLFPRDWRSSSGENMVALRESDVSRRLLSRSVSTNTVGQLTRTAVILYGSASLDRKFYESVAKSVQRSRAWGWKTCIEHLCELGLSDSYCMCRDESDCLGKGHLPFFLITKLLRTMNDTAVTLRDNKRDNISPSNFLYLLDRLRNIALCTEENFFATKSSLLEFIICHGGRFKLTTIHPYCVDRWFKMLMNLARDLLRDPDNLRKWIRRSHLIVDADEYFPLVVLRLVLHVCLLEMNFGDSLEALHALLATSWIAEQLPTEFYAILRQTQRDKPRHLSTNAISDAFRSIDDPLVLVHAPQVMVFHETRNDPSSFSSLDAIILDTAVHEKKEDMMKILFSKEVNREACDKSKETSDSVDGSNVVANDGEKFNVSATPTAVDEDEKDKQKDVEKKKKKGNSKSKAKKSKKGLRR